MAKTEIAISVSVDHLRSERDVQQRGKSDQRRSKHRLFLPAEGQDREDGERENRGQDRDEARAVECPRGGNVERD